MRNLTEAEPTIHRHRTAMVRHDLSQPVGLLVRHGLIGPTTEVFDYGCGQGDDLRILSSNGISASGWDPHFRPDANKTSADVVNIGFVLNVIERPSERVEALRAAWALARRTLAVATMVVGQGSTTGLRALGDGFVTSRGTFQKYFSQSELQSLISETLKVAPIAVAPGIFFVFREPEDEQDFLLERRAGRRLSAAAYRVPRPQTESSRATRAPISDRIPLTLEAIRAFALHRGRMPQADELPKVSRDELQEQSVSLSRAHDATLELALEPEAFAQAAEARREDLLVHYALALLNRSVTANRPSIAMVRDIRTHFGSQKEVSVQSTDYLKQLANEELVLRTAEVAEANGLGLFDDRQRFYVLGDRVDELPGVLRCYIGCATILAGEPVGAYVLRVDPLRRRVTMWPLNRADETFPRCEVRIQTDLRRQEVNIRPDSRRLLRRGELQGLSTRTRQRREEAAFRQAQGLPHEVIFEKYDATG